MPFIQISKLDAAKRQLDTAINLFFRETDPVSIHTLTCAAHEILFVIAKSQGLPTLLKDNVFIKEECRKEWHDKVVEAENFFKHGKRDAKAVLEFNPEQTDFYLLDAVEMYMQLTSEKTSSMIAFRAWFLLKYPQLLSVQGQQFVRFASRYNPENKNKFFNLINFLDSVDRSKL